MRLLALDIGSSSVKAGVLRDGKLVGQPVRATFPTRYETTRAEVDADKIVKAIANAIQQLKPHLKHIDAIALSVMAPSWVAMDAKGNALTPIVTHQDRRSVEIAREIEQRIGKARHMHLTGNRPFPGGISSTTAVWFKRNEPQIFRRADLIGHLNTYLHRRLTGARVTDPSNASFMGFYNTLTLRGWNNELCDAAGISKMLLPDVHESNEVGGFVRRPAAGEFGLMEGTPVFVGCMDTSAALLLIGTKPGQLLNVSGSTDVLALCTDKPKPHENLLTRAVGVGKRWMSVSTLAAAGSALQWVKNQMFSEMSQKQYFAIMSRLATRSAGVPKDSDVVFEPYLAGERTSLEQRRGALRNLTLSTTRQDMLAGVIEALAQASAARLDLLKKVNRSVRIKRKILLSGGVQAGSTDIMHRDWHGDWKFFSEDEATMRGLAKLVGD
jgi:xylulokinase